VAERLQRALLPDAVPEVHGTRIAVRYRPSAAGVEVGGDWYDVVSTPSGAWVSVGDVVGRGVEAAAFMGRARAMLQALTIGEDRPGPVLERFDAAIAAMPDDPFATVVLAHLRPAERSVVLALAGHPPPLVVAPDGTTTFVGRPQAPIGTSVARRYLAEEIPLTPGSTLVLYTDGLIERAGEIIDVGLARLAEAARPWAGSGDVEPMADDLLARLDVAGSDDDVAVVIVWLDPEGDR
jgi:serine phosphatase RsbU (regulator of sigma subunit)